MLIMLSREIRSVRIGPGQWFCYRTEGKGDQGFVLDMRDMQGKCDAAINDGSSNGRCSQILTRSFCASVSASRTTRGTAATTFRMMSDAAQIP